MVTTNKKLIGNHLVCPACGHREDAPDYLRAAYVLVEENSEGRYANDELRTRQELGDRLGVHGPRLNVMLAAIVQAGLAVKPWKDQDLFKGAKATRKSISHYEAKGWSFEMAHADAMKRRKAWYNGRGAGIEPQQTKVKNPVRIEAGKRAALKRTAQNRSEGARKGGLASQKSIKRKKK